MTATTALGTQIALRAGDPGQTALSAAQYLAFINMAVDDLSAAGWLQPISDDNSLVVVANQYTYAVPAGFAYIKKILGEDTQNGASVYTREIPEAHWELRLENGFAVIDFHTVSYLEVGKHLQLVGQQRFTGNLDGTATLVPGSEPFIRERAFAYACDALSMGEDEQAKRRGRMAEQAWIKSQNALKQHPQEFRVYPASRVVPNSTPGAGPNTIIAATQTIQTTLSNVNAVAAGPDAIFAINDPTAMAAGVGGRIMFRGKYTSAGLYAEFGAIEGYKINGTSGNFAGGLAFYTRKNGSSYWQQPALSLTDTGMAALILPGAVGNGGVVTPSALWILDGSAAAPNTNDNFPTVFISRNERTVNSGPNSAALYITTQGDGGPAGVGINQPGCIVLSDVRDGGSGDVCAISSITWHGLSGGGDHLTGVGIAYGYYIQAQGWHATLSGAIAIQTAVGNYSSSNYSYVPNGFNRYGILDLTNDPSGKYVGCYIQLRGYADVGIGALAGTTIVNAFLSDDSDGATSYRIRGHHVTGIDMSGATISGTAAAFQSSGTFTVTVVNGVSDAVILLQSAALASQSLSFWQSTTERARIGWFAGTGIGLYDAVHGRHMLEADTSWTPAANETPLHTYEGITPTRRQFKTKSGAGLGAGDLVVVLV